MCVYQRLHVFSSFGIFWPIFLHIWTKLNTLAFTNSPESCSLLLSKRVCIEKNALHTTTTAAAKKKKTIASFGAGAAQKFYGFVCGVKESDEDENRVDFVCVCMCKIDGNECTTWNLKWKKREKSGKIGLTKIKTKNNIYFVSKQKDTVQVGVCAHANDYDCVAV